MSFYDAYFSNFIEGTEFAVEEAAGIVFDGRIPAERPADAHDIAGVWRVASDTVAMARTPADSHDFLDLIRKHHVAILGNRSEVLPGQFKTVLNQAGGGVFVRPEDVVGTLDLKWSGKFRQDAKLVPIGKETHDGTPEIHGRLQAQSGG